LNQIFDTGSFIPFFYSVELNSDNTQHLWYRRPNVSCSLVPHHFFNNTLHFGHHINCSSWTVL